MSLHHSSTCVLVALFHHESTSISNHKVFTCVPPDVQNVAQLARYFLEVVNPLTWVLEMAQLKEETKDEDRVRFVYGDGYSTTFDILYQPKTKGDRRKRHNANIPELWISLSLVDSGSSEDGVDDVAGAFLDPRVPITSRLTSINSAAHPHFQLRVDGPKWPTQYQDGKRERDDIDNDEKVRFANVRSMPNCRSVAEEIVYSQRKISSAVSKGSLLSDASVAGTSAQTSGVGSKKAPKKAPATPNGAMSVAKNAAVPKSQGKAKGPAQGTKKVAATPVAAKGATKKAAVLKSQGKAKGPAKGAKKAAPTSAEPSNEDSENVAATPVAAKGAAKKATVLKLQGKAKGPAKETKKAAPTAAEPSNEGSENVAATPVAAKGAAEKAAVPKSQGKAKGPAKGTKKAVPTAAEPSDADSEKAAVSPVASKSGTTLPKSQENSNQTVEVTKKAAVSEKEPPLVAVEDIGSFTEKEEEVLMASFVGEQPATRKLSKKKRLELESKFNVSESEFLPSADEIQENEVVERETETKEMDTSNAQEASSEKENTARMSGSDERQEEKPTAGTKRKKADGQPPARKKNVTEKS